MLIGKTKYCNDIRDAHIQGFERGFVQGFELAWKVREVMIKEGNESISLHDVRQTGEFSRLLKELMDITRAKDVDLE